MLKNVVKPGREKNPVKLQWSKVIIAGTILKIVKKYIVKLKHGYLPRWFVHVIFAQIHAKGLRMEHVQLNFFDPGTMPVALIFELDQKFTFSPRCRNITILKQKEMSYYATGDSRLPLGSDLDFEKFLSHCILD